MLDRRPCCRIGHLLQVLILRPTHTRQHSRQRRQERVVLKVNTEIVRRKLADAGGLRSFCDKIVLEPELLKQIRSLWLF